MESFDVYPRDEIICVSSRVLAAGVICPKFTKTYKNNLNYNIENIILVHY